MAVSVVCRSMTPRRTGPPRARDARLRVFDDAGGDADAARTRGIARFVADVDRRAARPSTTRRASSPKCDQHEVRGARPVADAQPFERGVEQRLRLLHLREIPVVVLRVVERRAASATAAQAFRLNGGTMRRSRRERATGRRRRAPARRPARPYAFANVRPMIMFGSAGRLGIANQRLARRSRRTPRPRTSSTCGAAARSSGCPPAE